MFLHLGSETVIQTDTILGIFDLDNTTISRHSRDYLNRAEKSGRLINVSPLELPKSFIVCEAENVPLTVYLCQPSVQTLLGRLENSYSQKPIFKM